MIYLICQDWSNTSSNHAGMKYLCNTLVEKYPETYYSICIPFFMPQKSFRNRFLNRIQLIYARYKHKKFLDNIEEDLKVKIKDGDKIIFMEYMEKMFPVLSLVKKLKQSYKNIPIYALVHLVPSKLNANFIGKEFLTWIDSVDKILTFGNSLTNYLIKRGCNSNKIYTTFHYVDTEYYSKSSDDNKKKTGEIRVIAMGNQMRNVKLLKKIVTENPTVKFTICQGVCDFSQIFGGRQNVDLIPFVPECELKQYMEEADISLNVMEDTIGSNVIVTSMAMGLAMICSNVGSIHDYCDEMNCVFCNNTHADSFSNAISRLKENGKLLESMKKASVYNAQKLTIERFHYLISKI